MNSRMSRFPGGRYLYVFGEFNLQGDLFLEGDTRKFLRFLHRKILEMHLYTLVILIRL